MSIGGKRFGRFARITVIFNLKYAGDAGFQS
jgi:hypothetical protein